MCEFPSLHSRSTRGGFVLIITALVLVGLIGILGLTVDLSRMYVTRNELQAYADAASIAAAVELNGTSEGISHARNVATSYPNKWNFANTAPQSVTVEFSEAPAGPYVANPADPKGVKYVKVTATGPVTLYFLPGFSDLAPTTPAAFWFTIARQQGITARATSGQFLVSGFDDGLLPYSPDAPNPGDPVNFGLIPGQMHTIRWPPNGQRNQKNNWCDGDESLGYVTPNAADDRGFIDIAGQGSSDIRDAIINNKQTHPLYIGDVVVDRPGNRGTESDALRYRILQDTDPRSWTWSQYMANYNSATSTSKGNFRRFVILPINNPANNEVLGFGGFFLHSDICTNGGDSLMGSPGAGGGGSNVATCCAEYVGPAIMPGRKGGDNNVGAYKVKLFK